MAKPKAIHFKLIDRPPPEGGPRAEVQMYELLDWLVREWHMDLVEAAIGLAWRIGWKRNTDGLLPAGKAVKASDPQRELHSYDFVILLNREIWESIEKGQRMALLDHELCHCAPALTADGEQKRDERGRPLWRIRKHHDLEEFQAVVERHGCYTADIEAFARAALEKSFQRLREEGAPVRRDER